jgi:4-amino-4-deoxy-L-arabinose transferase-like glycosyltransferase
VPPLREQIASQSGGAGFPRASGLLSAWPAERHLTWLLVCVAGLTLFRLGALALARTDLFFDEAQYWFWSRELAFGYYSKPPLIAWIIRGATEVCGMSEACIRAPSPIIHAATALVVYGVGRELYDPRIGFWSGLVYATLPGVSFSSAIISTDVPLLFCVALALYAVIRMEASGSWRWGVILGLAIGFGLNAKYAMSYFLLGLIVYALATRRGRMLLRDVRLYAALAIAAALIAPNIWWNAQNKFATFAHTAENANWGGSLFHPDNMADFLLSQLGVFGPVLLAVLLIVALRWWRREPTTGNRDAEALLLSFSLPVLGLMLIQALLSRAHANWAAFAYVAATVLVTAALIQLDWMRLFRASLILHLGALLLLGLGGALAGRIELPGGADPYARVLGWKALAEMAGEKAEAGGFRAIATDKRSLAAELLYYLRDRNISVVAVRGDGPPHDHFELTRPLNEATPRPVLLVSPGGKSTLDAELVETANLPAGAEHRRVSFYRLRD